MNIEQKVGFKFQHSVQRNDENRFVMYLIAEPIDPVRDGVCECLYFSDYHNGIYLNMEYAPSKDQVVDLLFRGKDFDIHIIHDKIVSGVPIPNQDKNELLCRAKAKLFQIKSEFGIEAKLAEYQSAESLKKGLDLL